VIDMRFEIEGDANSILEALKIFKEEGEKEYKIQLEKAKKMTEKLGYVSPIQAQIPLPDVFPFFYRKEGDKVIVEIPSFMPKQLQKAFKLMRKHKKMEKNLQKFLNEMGVKAKVKYVDD